MKITRHALILATAALVAIPLHASALPSTITFDTEADFTGNFTVLNGSGLAWNSEYKNLTKTDTGIENVLLLPEATGLSDVTVSMDARFSSTSPSIGLWQGVTSTPSTTGFLGLVNRISDTQVQLRIFAAANPNATLPAVFYNNTFTIDTFATDTFYTAEFTAVATATGTNLTLSFLAIGNPVPLATTGVIFSTDVMKGTQVGFRAASLTLSLDNFRVASAGPIPEPATISALFGACALAVAATGMCRKRLR
ncbi:MAG: hypothetical protein LBK99_15170 [Opitutaceae bacterium]|jgi:hypothetical protein|nr:hypothetical protein [Opitutaceae bacterium]